jgi:hypothetical protein
MSYDDTYSRDTEFKHQENKEITYLLKYLDCFLDFCQTYGYKHDDDKIISKLEANNDHSAVALATAIEYLSCRDQKNATATALGDVAMILIRNDYGHINRAQMVESARQLLIKARNELSSSLSEQRRQGEKERA